MMFRWTALACAALLTACASAPPYTPPAPGVPELWREAAAADALWQPAQASADAPANTLADAPADWWAVYGDAALNALQQQAAWGNLNVAQAVARQRAARAQWDASRASTLPTLGATASTTRSQSPGSPATPSTSTSLGLTASWELDLWGRLAASVQAGAASAQASDADVAAMRLSVQASVAHTYFALRAAEAHAALLRDTLAAYERTQRTVGHRYTAGLVSAADVAQAEAQTQSTRVQLLEAQTSRAQLEHALAALLGVPPAAFRLPVGADAQVLPTPPTVPATLPSQLLERRPDIAAAERRVAAANAQIGVAQAARFPALTLGASAGSRAADVASLLTTPTMFWSLGPALAASLFDGGARSAAVQSARASHEQASAAYRQTVLTALQEVEDALIAAAHLAQEQQWQQQAVAAAQRALEVAENQYRAGTVAYLNVLTAQTTVLAARRSLIDIQTRRLQAVNQLLKNVAGQPLAHDETPER